MLALRRARLAASPPFLRGSFRPFFFLGASWAAIDATTNMDANMSNDMNMTMNADGNATTTTTTTTTNNAM